MTVCATCGGNGYLRHDDNAPCPECVVPDAPPPRHPAPREVALEIARTLITGDRAQQYGPAQKNHQTIADLWTLFMGTDFDAAQAATMMALVKIARMKVNPKKEDNYIDAIGYLALAYEFVQSHDKGSGAAGGLGRAKYGRKDA